MNLDDVAHRLAAMPDQEREGVLASALRLTSSFAWTPLPGPQMAAFFTPADVTYFGGAGGGGFCFFPACAALPPGPLRFLGGRRAQLR